MRPLLYDATHLVSRQGIVSPTGIDRVDQAYGQALASDLYAGLHFGLFRPHRLAPERVAKLSARLSEGWRDDPDHDDPVLSATRRFLLEERTGGSTLLARASSRRETLRHKAGNLTHILGQRFSWDGRFSVPDDAVYLSVAQHGLELPFFFDWMRRYPGLAPVFMLHDLIPLDLPEYFPAGRKQRFQRIIETAFAHAAGFIVTTGAVRERLETELRRYGRRPPPIHVAHLPVPDGFDVRLRLDPDLADVPYVVVVGTVEPRKNHWMLLHAWRRMILAGTRPPKLVIIGAKGWENEVVFDLLTKSTILRGHVVHVAGLSNAGLRELVANARALLMPSFMEGYGIPIIEALALGTPVIASDLPVFREVSQGCATFVSPIDGLGWGRAILDHSRVRRLSNQMFTAPVPGFTVPTAERYFDGVRGFLDQVGR